MSQCHLRKLRSLMPRTWVVVGVEAERYAHLLQLPRLRLLAVWPAPDRLASNANIDFATVIVRT